MRVTIRRCCHSSKGPTPNFRVDMDLQKPREVVSTPTHAMVMSGLMLPLYVLFSSPRLPAASVLRVRRLCALYANLYSVIRTRCDISRPHSRSHSASPNFELDAISSDNDREFGGPVSQLSGNRRSSGGICGTAQLRLQLRSRVRVLGKLLQHQTRHGHQSVFCQRRIVSALRASLRRCTFQMPSIWERDVSFMFVVCSKSSA